MSEDPSGRTALDVPLPFEQLNPIAELESWRKEVNRPLYHVHKWWATRLGSVFRAMILAGNLPPEADLWAEFYREHDFSDCVVLDCFMGSGTTIGEALKLGCRAVGCDINPVAYFQVRKALEGCDESLLRLAYDRLRSDVAPKIREVYKSTYDAVSADVLYTFWVKTLRCPSCNAKTRLFDSWIFASNAYPTRKPESQALCPKCGEVNKIAYSDSEARCKECSWVFDPQSGPVRGQNFRCESCEKESSILSVCRASGSIPQHDMYALMLLLPDGTKVYKKPDSDDHALYAEAERRLREGTFPIPNTSIPPGHNTDQARAYNYHHWSQMFNARQLYALGILLSGILREPNSAVREMFLLLFSGLLEFNNMFCSFKGEGTGAVRHLFHHHILKPERVPLEANPWGTAKSSGSFSTLFERRLISAIRYCSDPFELQLASNTAGKVVGKKVFKINKPIQPRFARNFSELVKQDAEVLLLQGDSSKLPMIPNASVDLVITDPPYFDNVHYSELADFFYCWLRIGMQGNDQAFDAETTRHSSEVQDKNSVEFGKRLGDVFVECARVLKRGGRLAFTFHHSRNEAWLALAKAIESAGLEVVVTHPVKAEMSGATPKNQAKEPIDIDLIVVCRHLSANDQGVTRDFLNSCVAEASSFVLRYNRIGTRLSRGDIRVILMGEFLKVHSHIRTLQQSTCEDFTSLLAAQIESLYKGQSSTQDAGHTQPTATAVVGESSVQPILDGLLKAI
ncbi:MAG TPA: DNA methyltransferase [Terriglobales bacterium]|nr:DNA methyltransferase [Terriglobales bacterium]